MDTQRIIGALEEQGRHTEIRMNRMEGKIDTLLADKWMRQGAAVVVAGMVSFIVSIVIEIARAK